MSNPKRIPIGTSGKILKGDILLSRRSRSSGMNGVMIGNKLGNGVTQLGIVDGRAAEGTPVLAFGAGRAFTS